MFTVVGCRECDALWIVEGRPDTTQCRRCGTRHDFDTLRALAEVEDRSTARTARSRLLAERSGLADAETVDATEGGEFEEVIDDETYLEAHGIDPAEASEAGASRTDTTKSRSEIVRTAIRTLEEPTETAVIEHATSRGVSKSDVIRTLEKLVRAGEAIESDGEYRLL